MYPEREFPACAALECVLELHRTPQRGDALDANLPENALSQHFRSVATDCFRLTS